ncbi:MAG: right-handed parallel beta-helix repeat-containing protein [Thermoplasmatota archaeon]
MMNRKLTLVCIILMIISLVPPVFSTADAETVQDLTVDEGESKSYSYQQMIVDGDISVRGTLELKDVQLILDSSEENIFRIEESGTLNIQNSEILSYQDYVKREITYNLSEGYNMISLPFLREDDSIRSVLSPFEGNYDIARYYDAEKNTFPSYMPYRSDVFNDLDNIDESMGIILNITEPVDVTLGGYIPKRPSWELYEGDNWISYPYTEPKFASNVFSDIKDDIEAIRTQTTGESGGDWEEISMSDTMYPGKGYNIDMLNHTNLTLDVSYGISENDALNMDETGGMNLEFMRGSSGSITDTEIKGSGMEEGRPDITVRSNSVKIERCDFTDNHIGLRVDSCNPVVRDNHFQGSVKAGMDIISSSITIESNDFISSSGHAMTVKEGSPDIIDNQISGEAGIYLKDSDAVIKENNISDILGNGISASGGGPIVEDNYFLSNNKASVHSKSSNITIRSNTFVGEDGAIFLQGGKPVIQDNIIEGGGYGIQIKSSEAVIEDNAMTETNGWAIRVTGTANTSISRNEMTRCTSGMYLSGISISALNNTVEDCRGIGIEADNCTDLNLAENMISNNEGNGILFTNSFGAIFDNTVSNNYGGVHLRDSSPQISNNTIANNNLFGISMTGGSPLIDNDVISGNKNNAIKCDGASPMIRTTSVTGSKYHLYMLSSNVTAINSFILEEQVWKTVDSTLTLLNRFEVSTDEDKTLDGYPLIEKLPPGARIRGYRTDDNVTVRNRQGYIDFTPPENEFGLMTIIFEISVSGQRSDFPVVLNVTPINDPPSISQQQVNITYKPTKVTWSIVYTDPDNELPKSVEVVIDGDGYPMKEHNLSDHNTSDGKRYYYEKYLEPGGHEYHFIVKENNTLGKDITKKTVTKTISLEPESVSFSNLVVIAIMAAIMLFLLIFGVYYSIRKNKKNRNGGASSDKKDDKTKEESPVDLVEKLENELNSLSMKKEDKDDLNVLKKKNEIEAGDYFSEYGSEISTLHRIKSLPVLHKRHHDDETNEVEEKQEIIGEEWEKKEERVEHIDERDIGDSGSTEEVIEDDEAPNQQEGEQDQEGPKTDLIQMVGDVDVGEEEDKELVLGEGEEIQEEDIKKKHRVIKTSKKEVVKKKTRVLKGEGQEDTSDDDSPKSDNENLDQVGMKKRKRVIKD